LRVHSDQRRGGRFHTRTWSEDSALRCQWPHWSFGDRLGGNGWRWPSSAMRVVLVLLILQPRKALRTVGRSVNGRGRIRVLQWYRLCVKRRRWRTGERLALQSRCRPGGNTPTPLDIC